MLRCSISRFLHGARTEGTHQLLTFSALSLGMPLVYIACTPGSMIGFDINEVVQTEKL
jgi:hypothetical protein